MKKRAYPTKMPCDLLVFAPHPDDAEIYCGGTIAAMQRQGASVVVVDATAGEMASRGTPELRIEEAAKAAEILGLQTRENLGLPDAYIDASNHEHRKAIVCAIRTHQPQVIACTPEQVAHPDHRGLHELVRICHKAAALHKYPPPDLPTWQKGRVICYEAEHPITPDFLVACSKEDWERKLAAMACYGSQLAKVNDIGNEEPKTKVGSNGFSEWISARGRTWGDHIGADYAEAFCNGVGIIGLPNLLSIK